MRIAEEGGQRGALLAHLLILAGVQPIEDLGPTGRHGHLPASLEGVANGGQEDHPAGVVGSFAQAVNQQGDNVLFSGRSEPFHHERQQLRNLTVEGQCKRAGRIDVGKWFDGVPVHERQVVIVGVLRVGEQGSRDVPAIFQLHTL